MFKVIGFDWDGTLFDSMSFKRANFINLMAKEQNDRSRVAALHAKYSGIPRKDLFNQVHQEIYGGTLGNLEFSELSQKYSALNNISAKEAKLFPEVVDTLNKLQNSFKFFISSSMPHSELVETVDTKKLGHFFMEVLGSEPGFGKGPEHMLFIQEKYKLGKQDLLFVGDDQKDVELALNAGVKCLRIERGLSTNSVGIIRSLADIIQFEEICQK